MDASGGQGHGGAASALVPTMQAASLGMCSTKKNINNNRDMLRTNFLLQYLILDLIIWNGQF